jgi:uncharacterized membrane protein
LGIVSNEHNQDVRTYPDPTRIAQSAYWRNARTRTRICMSIAAGILAAIVSGVFGTGRFAPLIGWDIAATMFSAWAWAAVVGMDARQTAAHALRDDPGRAAADVLVLGACATSLIGVGAVLGAANAAHGASQGILASLAVASVAVSWTLVHTVFTLRYARLYYADDAGIEFNQEGRPAYTDVAYLAFTVGMTFQVSDTAITSHKLRTSVLHHAL